MKREREFLDRVADALADLPARRRRDLLRDLAAHLDELPPEARAELGPREQYARELREALDMPERALPERDDSDDGGSPRRSC